MHGAQGVSVDTTHALATGGESRQQLYTMLTRGAAANHVYVAVVGDGDPHDVIRPENIHPPTATDLLEGILARDDTPTSATTFLRDQAEPAPRLAARRRPIPRRPPRRRRGPHRSAQPSRRSTRPRQTLVPGIDEDPAWPTLRSHLILLAATGADPKASLQHAVATRELDTAGDRAAVLDWRLDDTALRHAGPGPLPWLPAIPAALVDHPTWGAYLSARATLVDDLASDVRDAATGRSPALAPTRTAHPRPAGARRRCRLAGGERRPRHRPSPHRTTSALQGSRPLAARPRVTAHLDPLAGPGAVVATPRRPRPRPQPRPRHHAPG